VYYKNNVSFHLICMFSRDANAIVFGLPHTEQLNSWSSTLEEKQHYPLNHRCCFASFGIRVRDRPFNLQGAGGLWFFVSFRIFFSDNTRVRIFIFFVAWTNFFFQNLTLGYMTKNLAQIIFFFLHQNQNIFFSTIGNQNIFLEKKP
jgi:hypothetical protein